MISISEMISSRRIYFHAGVVLASVLVSSACSRDSRDEPRVDETPPMEVAQPKQCIESAELGKYGRHFARKDVWDRLPKANTLRDAVEDYDIVAIDITQFGLIGELGWHEGLDVCVQVRNGEAWARPLDSVNEAWKGPFISVDTSYGIDAAYVNRIFGLACFETQEDGDWCFKNGSLHVGTNVYQAKIILDTTEMPTYGIPVKVDGDPENVWMFVRAEDRWRVFKDEYLTRPGHVDVDPSKAQPWRELVTKHGVTD